MGVRRRDRQRLLGDVLGEAIGELRAIGNDDFGNASNLCGRRCSRIAAVAGDQYMNFIAAFGSSGHSIQGTRFERGIVVFGNDECGHGVVSLFFNIRQMTLASFFSFATSVATSGTMVPAERLGGSATFRVFSRGVTSTPSSSGFTTSSCFFLAFMMLGSVT